MAKLNLSQAAKVTGKNRTTIWRHINSGKLSAERDRDGMPFVDTSELLRVYGELRNNATPAAEEIQHHATHGYPELVEVIELLRKEQAEMRVQIESLTNRLNAPSNLRDPIHQKEQMPEDDPDWPRSINSVADIMLRNEIKSKYLKK